MPNPPHQSTDKSTSSRSARIASAFLRAALSDPHSRISFWNGPPSVLWSLQLKYSIPLSRFLH